VDWFEDKAQCARCGLVWLAGPDKRGRSDVLCASCRMRPAKSIGYGHRKPCLPGSVFDEFDNPLINGHALVGETICQHRDCIELSHRSYS
jgi:hypothetical protein